MISDPKTEVDSQEHKPHPPSSSTLRHSKKNRQTDPRIRQISKNILENSDLSEVKYENAQLIINDLSKIQASFQSNKNYKQAEFVDQWIQKVKPFLVHNKYQAIQAEKAETYTEILDNTKNENIDLKNLWEDVIRNAEEKRDEDLRQLQAEFDNELMQYDVQFEQEPSIKFQKYSAEYLNLRARQKSMIISEHFLEAKNVKELADKMEEKEKMKQQESWIMFLQQGRDDIIRKQNNKLDSRVNMWDKSIEQMKRQAKFEILHAKRSENYLAHKIDTVNEIIIPEKIDQSGSKTNAEVHCRNLAPTSKSSTSARCQRKMPTKIIRPLSEREMQFRERKKANYVTYSKFQSPRMSKK